MANVKDLVQKKRKELQELRSAAADVEKELLSLNTKLINERVNDKIDQFYARLIEEPIGLNRWIIVASLTQEKSAGDISMESTPISLMGSGPWLFEDLSSFLSEMEFEVSKDHSKTEFIILGQQDFDEDQLERAIEDSIHDGRQLKIYSQELFLYWILSGEDPLDAWEDKAIFESIKGHKGINAVIGYEGFDWPNPTISNHHDDTIETIDASEWSGESTLHRIGYNATQGALSTSERQRLLEKFYKMSLKEHLDEPGGLRKWGNPMSTQRLYALAEFLSWLVRFQGGAKPKAADKWKADLEWLKKNFYKTGMKFVWPRTVGLVSSNSAARKGGKQISTRSGKSVPMGESDKDQLYKPEQLHENQEVFSEQFGWGKILHVNKIQAYVLFHKNGMRTLTLEHANLKVKKAASSSSKKKSALQSVPIISAPLIKPMF